MSILLIQPELYQQLFGNQTKNEVIQMPDWEKLHERKRKEINLGIAKKSALTILRGRESIPNWNIAYKETVRQLYRLYEELDKEILQENGMVVR